MNGFKKLVLASAVLAATSGAYAMEAMDDESMSTTTGQDGLTITLNSSMSDLVIKYVDRDGLTGIAGGTGYTNAGAVVIGAAGAGVDVNLVGLQIDIDAGGSAGDTSGGGSLNIKVGMQTSTIGLGNVVIGVADASNTTGSSSVGTVAGIISFDASAALTIAGNADLMNIQLGNEPQGDMVLVNANLGSVTLTGLSINDVNSSGSIAIGTLKVSSLQLVNAINVVAGGLEIDTTGTTIGEVGLEQVRLGDATQADIGDIYISGITANSVITVTGH